MEVHLLSASKDGDVELIQDLLENVVIDINHRDDEGQTALYTACEEGKTEIVKMLLDSNADPNICTKEQQCTPLTIAAKNGHVKVVIDTVQDFLIKLGIKPRMHILEISIFYEIMTSSDLPEFRIINNLNV